ncbi:MAG: cytochrome c oxidase assembly protein [Betaproteobacteria bacterium]|nr:cytochrome c oxidase assembly protein [Betaproteobacteria bacterium]
MSPADPSASAVQAAPRAARGLNLQMLGKLVVMAGLMFGFGYALVPIYQAICEVTGLNDITKRDKGAEEFARNTQVDRSRKITVEFDANMRGTMLFKPEVNALEVHPGELITVVYDLVNTREVPTAGQAIPSYAPQQSSPYFRKLECFCFKQQALDPNETRKFPVVFVVDPKLPREVNTITLSYTFFEVGGLAPKSGG